MEFNEQQKQAINFKEGNCLVNASSGSGKTSVLVNRIAKLVNEDKVDPSEILAITFTKNAGENLVQRLKKLGVEGIATGTYHSICYRILASNGITIKSPIDFKIQNEFKKVQRGKSVSSYFGIMGFISYQKSFDRGVDDEFVVSNSLSPILEEYTIEQLREFYRAYEELKVREGWLDFDDYLLKARDLLREDKKNGTNKIKTYEYLLVDEYQDNNNVQEELSKLLCKGNNVFTVGDVKQCLYGFNGSNSHIFMDFPKKNNATVIDLYMNYRSCNNIVEISNRFIAPYYKDFENYRDSEAFNKEDGNIMAMDYRDEEEEARGVANKIEEALKNGVKPNEIMVLYRNNVMSGSIEMELRQRNIPFDISKEGSFFKRREIDIILCVLRLMSNPSDDIAYEQLVRYRCYPFNYVRNVAIEMLSETAYKKDSSLLLAYQYSNNNIKPQEKTSFSTFHSIVTRLNSRKLNGMPLSSIIDSIVNDLHLKDYIRDKSNTKEDLQTKLDSIAKIKALAKNKELNQFLSYCYDTKNIIKKKKNKEEQVRLMTIHKSKGLESQIVFVIGVNAEKFPSMIEGDGESEANLFYVAITRAKEELYVSSSNPSQYFSKFINLLEEYEEEKCLE